ncbi:hypothetical protein [Thiobacillus sp.]|uniref:hypothetical protein n=1 Tax=Thiobacillus sp. TaxID=924 RepID=UPI0011DA8BEF|nr:hypothetical protein [Thiobacillus sp.]TXH74949.1 MAG: hypothetical protein E6Q82_08145 [Thiobacillus sp.]
MDNQIVIGIIAATSALSGVALSQAISLVQSHLDRQHQKQVFLRSKYEELANHVTDGQLWLVELIESESLPQASLKTPIHALKAVTLAAIYFPLLLEDAQNYLNASALFQTVILENHQFIGGLNAGAQAVNKNRQAFENASDRFNNARHILNAKIIKHASQYTKA